MLLRADCIQEKPDQAATLGLPNRVLPNLWHFLSVPCRYDEGFGTPIWRLLPILLLAEISQNFCLSHTSPASGRPYRLRSSGATGSSIESNSGDNLLPKDEEASVRLSFRLVCVRSRHHLFVQSSRCDLEITSRTFASVKCGAEAPCSVKTV